MTVKKVIRNLPLIKKFSSIARNKRFRHKFTNNCNKCVITSISEITRNFLKGNIPCSKRKVQNLKPYQRHIRELSKTNVSLAKKKRIINQHGGFLPQILIPAITLLAGIASDKLLK